MDTILIFSTSTGRARTDMLAGVREFARDAEWDIQSFKFDGIPFPVRDLLKFWSPTGCIVEGCGNGVIPGIIPRTALMQTPTVYLGSEPSVTPRGATCVVHDAVSTANTAAKELLSAGMKHFAFIGALGKGWSGRRKDAFVAAMRLNGHNVVSTDIVPSSSGVYGKGADKLKKWLVALPKPCGLMAADDELAATILAVCRLSGIAVPDDIAVVGVDDNESICENTTPTLSSVRMDFRQGGRFAAKLLARKLYGEYSGQQKTVFAATGIVRRASTRIFLHKDSEVSAALDRIWGTNGASLTAKKILEGFSCSRRMAEMRFRSATGKSVLQELTAARLERAKTLLSETSLPISEIAIQCGHRFPVHFRNAFRNATGLNPLEWRKHQTMIPPRGLHLPIT